MVFAKQYKPVLLALIKKHKALAVACLVLFLWLLLVFVLRGVDFYRSPFQI